MNFALALIIYLLVFIVLLYAFSKQGMGLFSALTLTALITAIILLLLIPPSEIDEQVDIFFSDKKHRRVNDWVALIYLIILILTLLLIVAYVVFKAYEDKNRRLKVYGDDYLCDFNDYLKFW